MQPNAVTRPGGRLGSQKIILLVLAVLALASVFLLPRFVTEPWAGGDSGQRRAVPNASPSNVAPSVAAESTRYRQESQSVLAQAIPVRDLLASQNVAYWADLEYQQALAKIQAGDQQYSFGEYAQALDTYRQALAELQQIEQLGQQKLADALSSGAAAVESLNLGMAASSSELATRIAAQDPAVKLLSSRAAALPALAGFMDAGGKARDAGQLTEARSAYEQAVALDPLHTRARELLAETRTAITDAGFRQHMSRGYAAFENDDFETARSAFIDADKVYPGNAAVTQALDQLQNRDSQLKIDRQMQNAAALEAAEEWQQAAVLYEQLLAQDPSLLEAQVKVIPARVRADLDDKLTGLLEDPLKIADQATYRLAQQVLTDAQGISSPGNRLQGQIELLQTRLQQVVTPVNVVFRSDMLTHVVLYKVADLGQFDQTSLTLRPGRYIAAGTRAGYRDVRVEFSITGEPQDEPITVACSEPI